MSQDTERVEIPQGIDLTPTDPLKPPITGNLPDNGSDQTLFQFTRGNSTFSFGINANNGLTFNGFTSTPGGDGGKSRTQLPVVFPGRIDSYQGANLYTVTIYRNGLDADGEEVTVLQIEGDPDFPQTADGTRKTFVVQIGQNYYMNMPVWG